jgi:hypothetical protein
MKNKIIKTVSIIFTILVLVGIGSFTFFKFTTPNSIAYPQNDHLHFRFQYIYKGTPENFSNSKYQVDYTKDICNGNLTTAPFHFHDDVDQISHVHWQNLTGGQLLKFYGLNFIGGLDDTMGYKVDELPKVTNVPIYGKLLPKAIGNDKYWIYIGDENNFSEKNFDDFKNKTLEEFIGKNSIVREQFEDAKKYNFIKNNGILTALAHNDLNHQTKEEEIQHNKEEVIQLDTEVNQATNKPLNATDTEEKKRINNLIGNIVIFVQESAPSTDQVKDQFNKLVPLKDSVCGG